MNSPYWSERHLPWYANCYSSWGLGTLNWTHAFTSTGVFSRARASNFSGKTRSRRDVFRIVAADGGCSGPEYFRCDIILGPVPLVEILKENGSSNVSCNQKHFSMAPIRALDIVCSPHYPIWRTRTKSCVGLLCVSLIFDATKVFMFFQQSMQPEELSLFIIFVFVLHLPILAVSHCRSRGEINVAHVPIDSR